MQVFLFAQPDESSIDAALEVRPDALVVGPSGCRVARERSHANPASPRLWIPIAPLDQGRAEAEIATAIETRPDALCLAGAVGRHDVEHLGAKLAIAEAEHSRPDGCTGIVAVVDRAAAIAPLSTIAAGGRGRLVGLMLDFAGLRTDIGCGPDSAALAMALGTFILAARSADVPAIFLLNGSGDAEVAGRVAAARAEGFTAVLVDQPGAVAAVRAALRPGSDA